MMLLLRNGENYGTGERIIWPYRSLLVKIMPNTILDDTKLLVQKRNQHLVQLIRPIRVDPMPGFRQNSQFTFWKQPPDGLHILFRKVCRPPSFYKKSGALKRIASGYGRQYLVIMLVQGGQVHLPAVAAFFVATQVFK